ncbi:RDD family protein [Rhodococcus marinonascens]|uniref:RDD family protein n=1 Tax=Rhodococcus marinonascens TaxID=38311 RepID=UPI000933EBA6|nr:RDD family protein [Rhodococcus marinonascens]
MTTGGFDPNQAQPPFGGHPQYGQRQNHGAQQQFGAQPQFDSGQQFYTRQFAMADFGFNQSTPGGLLPRIGARLIDHLIVVIPILIVTSVIPSDLGWYLGSTIVAGVWLMTAMGYFVFLETRGRTLGKQLLGLRVEGPNGGLPTRHQSIVRNSFNVLIALGWLPIIGLPFRLLGFIAMIVICVTIGNSPTRQGKHDEFAFGTRVVKG